MKKYCVAVLLFLCATCAMAQQPRKNTDVAQPMANVRPQVTQLDPQLVTKRQIEILRNQVKELKRQLDLVAQQTASIRNSFPKCSADLKTSSSPQGSRDCWPYVCDQVVGTCLMQCATTDDCGMGTACDTQAARCISTR